MKFHTVGVDLSTYHVNPKSKTPHKRKPGMKKGSGGVVAPGAPAAEGVAEGSVEFIRGLMLEAIEDITGTEEAATAEAEPTAGEELPDSVMKRTVKGAHLVYKRQSDIDSYEELWVYKVDPKDPTAHGKIESLILAGTDIEPTTMSSEDGSQRANGWLAGNAKMLHLSGLVN